MHLVWNISSWQIAGCIAYRFKETDPSLGCYEWELTESQAKSIYMHLVNRGGLTFPKNEWLEIVTEMYHLFNKHHGSKVFFYQIFGYDHILINSLIILTVKVFYYQSFKVYIFFLVSSTQISCQYFSHYYVWFMSFGQNGK